MSSAAATTATGSSLDALSLTLLRLVSGLAQPDAPADDDEDEPAHEIRRIRHRARQHRLQNEDGAFCWREGCEDCLSLSKAVQTTAENLSAMGHLYEANVRIAHDSLMAVAESVKCTGRDYPTTPARAAGRV